eukprot:869004_1
MCLGEKTGKQLQNTNRTNFGVEQHKAQKVDVKRTLEVDPKLDHTPGSSDVLQQLTFLQVEQDAVASEPAGSTFMDEGIQCSILGPNSRSIPPTKTYDRTTAWREKVDKRLNELRKETKKKEAEVCTFSPQTLPGRRLSLPELSSVSDLRSKLPSLHSSMSTSSLSPLRNSIYERGKSWQNMKERTAAELRKLKSQKELEECTFRPKLTKSGPPSHSSGSHPSTLLS